MRIRGRSTGKSLLWYAGGFAAAVVIGWLAALLHAAGLAPLGLVSLGIGIALGGVLAGLAARLELAGRARLVLGTLVLAAATVLSEHAWLYRDFRRQWHEARTESPEVAMFRPESPWSPREYFTRELTPKRAVLWSVDAALVAAAALATIWVWQARRK